MGIINQCLFPVAGYGTRFLPVTKAIPKEMLPILTKPLIQYAVEEAMSAGICSCNLIICNSTLSLSLVHKSSGKITANASASINGLRN
jgi:UTP-glucose-1-phosphate uridylyltransferase